MGVTKDRRRGERRRVRARTTRIAGLPLRLWSLEAIAFVGLWFLFVARLSAVELAIGGAATVFAIAVGEMVRRRSTDFPGFRPRLAWLLLAWRLPIDVATGCWVIFVDLAQHLAGRKSESRFRRVPFDAGGDTPPALARRALAVAYTTVPPNFIVADVDRDRGALVVHQVKPGDVPVVARRLGAR